MKAIVNYVLKSLGFINGFDFLESSFHISATKTIILVAGLTGTLSALIKDYVGIEAVAYIAMLLLFAIEFGTGVYVSLKIKKKKFNSKRFGRIVVKISLYTILLVIFNLLRHNIDQFHLMSLKINFFEWIYYIVLNTILIQLIVSVLENLAEMGFKEGTLIVRLIKQNFKKYTDGSNEATPELKDEED